MALDSVVYNPWSSAHWAIIYQDDPASQVVVPEYELGRNLCGVLWGLGSLLLRCLLQPQEWLWVNSNIKAILILPGHCVHSPLSQGVISENLFPHKTSHTN